MQPSRGVDPSQPPSSPMAAPLVEGVPIDYGLRVGESGQSNVVAASKSHMHNDDNLPSRLLWVGNISIDSTEAILAEVFEKFGTIENMSVYPQRSYAFIEFKSLEDAKAAKAGLQGKVVKGQSIRIEFAKPAKPSRHLWIWGVSENITKEQLELEFTKYGALEDFRLLRDRNSALAEYKNVEDATAAKEGLNKIHMGGEVLRVDFLRSQPIKRWSTAVEAHTLDLFDGKGKKEEEPSETLRISFPSSLRVDEEGLRRAFILFGEVEHIKIFPDRHYCFVQFRNADEATRAKDGLQGRLFNDPRVQIRFSSSENVFRGLPHQRESTIHLNLMLPRAPFTPHDMLSPGRPRINFQFPGRHAILQHDIRSRPPILGLGGQGGVLPSGFGGNSFIRGAVPDVRAALESNMQPLSRPVAPTSFGITSTVRPMMDSHVIPDRDFAREHKRAKMGNHGPFERGSIMGSQIVREGLEINQAGIPFSSIGAENIDSSYHKVHTHPFIQAGAGLLGPGSIEHHFDTGHTNRTHMPEQAVNNWKWQGTIAKAGTVVCDAQSFPVGKGIGSPLPNVVNCVARTSLDMLAQHFHQALDFGVICFVPNGDTEKGRYRDFVRYLGDKHRAGVAKLADGTSLFLVPPSEFTESVLKVPGDLLLGLVIKSSQLGNLPPGYQQNQPLTLPHQHGQQQHVVQPQLQHPTAADMDTPPKAASPLSSLRASIQSGATGLSLASELVASLTSLQRQGSSGGIPNASGLLAAQSGNLDLVNHVTSQAPGPAPDHRLRQQTDGGLLPGPQGSDTPDGRQSDAAVGPPGKDLNHLVGLLSQHSQSQHAQSLLEHVLSSQPQTAASENSSLSFASLDKELQKRGLGGLAQSGLLADSGLVSAKGGPEAEKSNKFQATLQLAAALLQRMQNVGPSEQAPAL